MYKLLAPLSGFLGAMAAGCLMAGVIVQVRRGWQKRFREPFYDAILRPPGWGCLERRAAAIYDLASMSVGLPALWGLVGILAVLGKPLAWSGALCFALPMTVWGISFIRKRMVRARTEKLGFLGECAVAEALSPLIAKGWTVFHDVPFEFEGSRFNIDHVAVGSAGVVAIETKTVSKPRDGARSGNELRIDGECVILPGGRRIQPLRQARSQAVMLRNVLRQEGVAINFVLGVVALPGWTVFYKKGASPYIRDPRNLVAWLAEQPTKAGLQALDAAKEKLEARCRELRFE